MKVSNKLIAGGMGVIFVVILGIFLVYYNSLSSSSDKTTKETQPFEKYTKDLGAVPSLPPATESSVPSVPSIDSPSSSKGNTASTDGLNGLPVSGSEDSNSESSDDGSGADAASDENIAKMWFDIRSAKFDQSKVDDLTKAMTKFLEKGKIPQVVNAYPLNLVTSADYGFTYNLLRNPDSTSGLISLVLPKGSVDKRVVTFVITDIDHPSKVFVTDDLSVVPTNFGKAKVGDTYRFIVGGEVLNDKTLTDDGSVGLYEVSVDSDSAQVTPVKSGLNLKGAQVGTSEDQINFSRLGTAQAPFFYNDVENEGQTTDDLYLITSDDSKSNTYKLVVSEEGIKSEFVESTTN